MPWQKRCEDLAIELKTACEAVLRPSEIRLDDLAETMWDEPDDPNAWATHVIGRFNHFRIRERRTHHLFGRNWLPVRYWRTLVEFGVEEMFRVPSYAKQQGVWCSAKDPRITETARVMLNRFSAQHRIKLNFSPSRAE